MVERDRERSHGKGREIQFLYNYISSLIILPYISIVHGKLCNYKSKYLYRCHY